MAVLALLLESGRSGLLLPLFSEELDSPSCVQQLVILADEACHHPSCTFSHLHHSAAVELLYLDIHLYTHTV